MFVTTLSHLCNLNVTKVKDFCIVKPSIINQMKMKILPVVIEHTDADDSSAPHRRVMISSHPANSSDCCLPTTTAPFQAVTTTLPSR
jgi:hypothetical protein